MSGRTERVNARDLMDRIDTIVFEGESVRGWVQQLVRRSQAALAAAKANKFLNDNCGEELAELTDLAEALNAADSALAAVELAVQRREDKAA